MSILSVCLMVFPKNLWWLRLQQAMLWYLFGKFIAFY